MRNTDPPKREKKRKVVPASYKTPAVLLICPVKVFAVMEERKYVYLAMSKCLSDQIRTRGKTSVIVYMPFCNSYTITREKKKRNSFSRALSCSIQDNPAPTITQSVTIYVDIFASAFKSLKGGFFTFSNILASEWVIII